MEVIFQNQSKKVQDKLRPLTLYQVPANLLDNWVEIHLQPIGFRKQVCDATDRIATFLKENCFKDQDIKVHKVVKGGSSGKGTYLKNGSDADLVVFLSCFHSLQDMSEQCGDIIKDICKQLNECMEEIADEIQIKQPQNNNDPAGRPRQQRSCTFSIKSSDWKEAVEVDVLPAFDILGQVKKDMKPDPSVYIALINAGGGPGDFSPCFTELQRNFVKCSPTKLKSLIRLVKHWYKEYVKTKYENVPHKYALELLTIYAWEQGSGKEDFCIEEGFCTVLKLLCQYQELCIFWTKNYDFQNQIVGNYVKQQLKNPRPVILDPADPTGLVGHGARWDLVAAEAHVCLQSDCCNIPVKAIKLWDVMPFQEQSSNGGVVHLQSACYNNSPGPVKPWDVKPSLYKEEFSYWSYCTIL